MSTSRRGFLAGLLALPAAAMAPEELLWTPSKKIFLPPASGWITDDGHHVLTIDDYTREVLRIMHSKLDLFTVTSTEWPQLKVGDTITVRLPSYGRRP